MLEQVKVQNLLRRLQFVPRWSIVPVNRHQSVAEHCFSVAHIAAYLLPHTGLRSDLYTQYEILHYAIIHDVEEAVIGDVPTTLKTYIRSTLEEAEKKIVGFEIEKPTSQIRNLVKLADCIEAYLYLMEERTYRGNSGLKNVIKDVWNNTEEAHNKIEWKHDRTFSDFMISIKRVYFD